MDGFDRTSFDADPQDLALHLPAADQSHTECFLCLVDAEYNVWNC
jgi:hypothetical protein